LVASTTTPMPERPSACTTALPVPIVATAAVDTAMRFHVSFLAPG
jgi:hypothetical protein